MISLGASHSDRPVQGGKELCADGDLVQRILHVLPIGVALFDASDDDFRYVSGNSEFERLVRLGGHSVKGMPLARIFTGDQGGQVRQLFQWVRSSGQPSGVFAAARGEARDPTRLWNLDVSPLGMRDGPVTHLLVVVRESVERLATRERQEEEAQQLRERADHLADLEKAKSEFLNLASHELRGPAATLRGYLSMLEDGSLGPLPEALQRVLPVLQAKASQINLLASEMVEAARLEEKAMQLRRQPVDLRELLTHLVATAQTVAPNHHLVVQDRVRCPLMVMGDPMRLEIVVGNLIDNAIKYSPGGGEVFCDLSEANGLVLLAVRDTGIGIAKEDLPRLFVRFSRLATGPMAEVPGTGLGLYLARELARLHGGDILAVSRLGEGSEFTLSLPLGEPEAA
jgi:signal transduction histidine kinase